MKLSGYKWLVVALLWVVALLNYLDRQVIFAVFPLLQAELHVSSFQLGLLGTSFLWVYGLLSPLGGYAADRFSRRGVILTSLIAWSAITWLTGHSRTYGQLLAARGLMGISEACYLPAALAMIADYHDGQTRSRATGLHQSGLYAGIALGGAGGGWMGQYYGWRAAFFVLGIAGLIYAAVIAWGLKEAPKRPIDSPRAAEKWNSSAQSVNCYRRANSCSSPASTALRRLRIGACTRGWRCICTNASA